MTSFLPYAIVAGIAIVFFVVCYIMYSGRGSSAKQEENEQAGQVSQGKTASQQVAAYNSAMQHRQQVTSDTEPLSRISTVTVRERAEHPDETAFVTTKGEAVRRNGKIVYEASSRQDRKDDKEDLDATRVLSRDEILAAMDKVDKSEAAAYEAREEEAKKGRQHQIEPAYSGDGTAKAEKKEPFLSDMAAVVSADLAARQQDDKATEQRRPKRHIIDEVMKENARVATGTPEKAPQENDQPINDATTYFDADSVATKLAKAKPLSDETMVVKPVKAVSQAANNQGQTVADTVSDETQIISPLRVQQKQNPDIAASTVGAVAGVMEQDASHFSPWGNDLSGMNAKATTVSPSTHHSSIWDEEQPIDSPVVKQCVSHFLSRYGVVTPEMQRQTEYITAAAFRQIGCASDSDRQQALAPLIVQESMQNVQKAYAAHPDKYVAAIALQAFNDIVHCSPISTRHLVAIDALKVMPYLTSYHYKILSVLLLFLYSRNIHNVDKETFCQYIDKYVLPFLDGFPTERPYYQQLDYLHCTAYEGKETHFAEILSDSYPLIFRYRGFTEEELRKALKGQHMPAEFIVQSFNSPLYKLAMVDEAMSTRLFRLAGINDRAVQDHILRLTKKRPAAFSGEEALDIMEDISPILADLGDIWDSSMLRVSTLSLLGLYLAQGYVKEIIGEEFDLSRWFE